MGIEAKELAQHIATWLEGNNHAENPLAAQERFEIRGPVNLVALAESILWKLGSR